MRPIDRLKKASIVILLTIVLLVSSATPLQASRYGYDDNVATYVDIYYLNDIMEYIEAVYPFNVTRHELIEGALRGIFYNLDINSEYYTPEEFKEMYESVSGDFVGIGVYIEEKDGYILVVSPIEGSPGQKAGLKAGDLIVSVDGKDIKGLSANQASAIIKGEIGTSVNIGIRRDGVNGILYFDIVRDLIEVNPVSYEILEDSIGYIRISRFNDNTLDNMMVALAAMDDHGITKLIIDLRNNPGGYLHEVIEILKLFVPKGPLVHIKYQGNSIDTYRSSLPKAKYDLAVLVNEGSASASEIFAGAIQDSGAGTVIGTRTYGKGTVQNIIPLLNGDGIKLTIAEYLTPKERSIDGVGIVPDIVVEEKVESFDRELLAMSLLNKTRKPTLNAVGLDVLGAQELLKTLGYNIKELDGVLDQVTFQAIKDFQRDRGLYVYGRLDFTTQQHLIDATMEYILSKELIDIQLEKAVNTLKAN